VYPKRNSYAHFACCFCISTKFRIIPILIFGKNLSINYAYLVWFALNLLYQLKIAVSLMKLAAFKSHSFNLLANTQVCN